MYICIYIYINTYTLLLSLQLRSQYLNNKNQGPIVSKKMFGWLSSIWFVKLHCFFSGQPPFKICLTLSSIWSVNLDVFSQWAPPSQYYMVSFHRTSSFTETFVDARVPVWTEQVIWLKWDTYIYTYVQPSDYLGIHAYIPVYTYHLLIHEPQGPRYHVKLWRLHDYTKQEENQFQDNRFEVEQAIN